MRSEGPMVRNHLEARGGCLVCYVGRMLCRTVYTSSSLLRPSKSGIRSWSSVSVMSSNHDCTGT